MIINFAVEKIFKDSIVICWETLSYQKAHCSVICIHVKSPQEGVKKALDIILPYGVYDIVGTYGQVGEKEKRAYVEVCLLSMYSWYMNASGSDR